MRGNADFEGGKLVFVWIFQDDPNEYHERLNRLKQKYGNPSQCSLFPESLNMIRGDDPRDLCWAMKSGETLQIIAGGSIKYTSGYLNTKNIKNTRETLQNSVTFVQ